MIRFLKGNLFTSRAQALVNTVNCYGIMGKGVALAFKNRFPEMYTDYRSQCEMGKIRPGILTLYKNTDPWVINFPTKRHWKSRSRLEDIDLGLQQFALCYKDWGVTSVALPALGCGHGGLDWTEVKPLIEQRLGKLDIDIEVYEPGSEIIVSEAADPGMSKQDLVRDLFGNMVAPPRPKRKSKKRTKKTKKQ